MRMQGHQCQSLQRRHSRWGERFDGTVLFVRFRFIRLIELGLCSSDAVLLQRCRLELVHRAFPYWRAVADEACKAVLPVLRLAMRWPPRRCIRTIGLCSGLGDNRLTGTVPNTVSILSELINLCVLPFAVGRLKLVAACRVRNQCRLDRVEVWCALSGICRRTASSGPSPRQPP